MIPEARIAHHTAGRMRVKVPAKKGDSRYFEAAELTFKGYAPVTEVSSNPDTGSMLIQFSGNADAVLAFAESKQLFAIVQRIEKGTELHQSVKEGFNAIDRQIRDWTQGSINLGGIAFVALVGTGIYQIVKGNFTTIPWYSAFWYALGIFSKSAETKETPAVNGE